MLVFKPAERVTLWDRVKGKLPWFDTVIPVDMFNPRSKREWYRALAWEWAHGIVRAA